jgi:hypothetical protein
VIQACKKLRCQSALIDGEVIVQDENVHFHTEEINLDFNSWPSMSRTVDASILRLRHRYGDARQPH